MGKKRGWHDDLHSWASSVWVLQAELAVNPSEPRWSNIHPYYIKGHEKWKDHPLRVRDASNDGFGVFHYAGCLAFPGIEEKLVRKVLAHLNTGPAGYRLRFVLESLAQHQTSVLFGQKEEKRGGSGGAA